MLGVSEVRSPGRPLSLSSLSPPSLYSLSPPSLSSLCAVSGVPGDSAGWLAHGQRGVCMTLSMTVGCASPKVAPLLPFHLTEGVDNVEYRRGRVE